MHLRNLMVLIVSLALAGAAFGQKDQLKTGDSAPGLDIEKWVKGDEIAIEEGSVFVIDFWATWCGPCRATIPAFTEMQDLYAENDLVVIGVTKEEEETVERFVKKQGDKMEYRVAVDRRESTWRAWMGAAARSTIPTVFIVDRKGKIQFIGNPHEEQFQTVLMSVLDGRYDAELKREVEPIQRAADNARRVRNWRMCFKLMDDIIAKDPHVFAYTTLEKFEVMLIDQKDKEKAYDYARQLLVTYSDDASFLAALARKIATDPEIKAEDRDMDLAMDAADGVAAAGRSDDPQVKAVQALVHFHSGNYEEAVELQKRAYFMAKPKRKSSYRRVLRDYQKALQREQVKHESADG